MTKAAKAQARAKAKLEILKRDIVSLPCDELFTKHSFMHVSQVAQSHGLFLSKEHLSFIEKLKAEDVQKSRESNIRCAQAAERRQAIIRECEQMFAAGEVYAALLRANEHQILFAESTELRKAQDEVSGDHSQDDDFWGAQFRAIERKYRPVGFETWDEFPVAKGEIFRIVTEALSNPLDCHPDFLETAIRAISANKANNGLVWQKFLSEGFLDYKEIKIAITAYRRHSLTDYDVYLKSGVARDLAREFAREELNRGDHGSSKKIP